VELGHDDLGRGDAKLRVLANGNASAVVLHGDAAVCMHDDVDAIVSVGQMLVDGVVDDFPHAVVERCAVVGVSKVHPGPHSNGFESFQNLDAVGSIIIAHVPSLRSPQRALRVPILAASKAAESAWVFYRLEPMTTAHKSIGKWALKMPRRPLISDP
jgi:hypothetical protein